MGLQKRQNLPQGHNNGGNGQTWQKGSAIAKAITTTRTKQSADTGAQFLDVRHAAASTGFSMEDLMIKSNGHATKKAPTTSGMKTVLAGESAINIERRIRSAAVPVGAHSEDAAAVTEDLSLENFDASSLARRLMPKRPMWSYDVSSGRLHHREVQAFKQWLDDVRQLIMERGGYPPAFEQNLQVWRQLWRVLERCDVAVIVVDVRHPLMHLPPALLYHVTKTLQKPAVIVLNKLDAVAPSDAARWAECLLNGVPGISGVVGYSKEPVRTDDFGSLAIGKEALIEACHAAHAKAIAAKATAEAAAAAAAPPPPSPDFSAGDVIPSASFTGKKLGYYFGTCLVEGQRVTGYYRDAVQAEPRVVPGASATVGYPDATAAAVPTASSVPAAAKQEAPAISAQGVVEGCTALDGRIMLGLVGHPNVGKSSMVNSLMGDKVVSVKATPGHTKTLQTMVLDAKTCLCDSPGVVFPRLEVPRETQIVGMLIPVAQVREPFSAIRWVMERSTTPLPQVLGLKPVYLPRAIELQEAGTDAIRLDLIESADDEPLPWSPMLVCAQYAVMRSFVNNGRPDVHKSGVEILERVLAGRIPYSVRPPATFVPVAKEERDDDAESEDDDDWQIDDGDFESEEEAEPSKSIFEVFGMEEKGPGGGSIASRKKHARRQKLAALAGDD